MVAKDIYQCRQCVSKRTLADEKEVNTFIEDDTWENGIFGAAQTMIIIIIMNTYIAHTSWI